jgi:hypothetical protein
MWRRFRSAKTQANRHAFPIGAQDGCRCLCLTKCTTPHDIRSTVCPGGLIRSVARASGPESLEAALTEDYFLRGYRGCDHGPIMTEVYERPLNFISNFIYFLLPIPLYFR